MRTAVSGLALLMARQASIPFMPSIRTSIRITSGSNCWASRIASMAEPASPVTSRSSSASRMDLMPLRTTS